MRKSFVLLAMMIVISSSIETRSQSAESPTLLFQDFSIRLPRDWVTTRASGVLICNMEGVKRTDGATPQLSVQAIDDRGQNNEQLTSFVLTKYSDFTVVAKAEYVSTLAHLSAYRIELKLKPKNQSDKLQEQIEVYSGWWAVRVPSQKKIFLIDFVDLVDDLADGLKSAAVAFSSFKPTH
jgi:hypothetical protein